MTGALSAAAAASRSASAAIPAAAQGPRAGPETALAIALGLLFALGTFLVLRRDVVRVVWGVAIISQSANVFLITMGGIGGGVPVLEKIGHEAAPHGPVTDPLPQALVLTAIVIGFATTAFALVLTYRVYEEHGTIDGDELADAGEVVR